MPDDYAADTSTAGTVTSGGHERGEIESAGDRDWFAVELVAGRTYVVDLEGSPTGDGTLANPYLHGIHDSSGVLIAGTTDDDGGTGRNSQLTFAAKKSGTHYIVAGAYWAETGSYTLRVAEETPAADDFTDTAETAGTVAAGGSATGEIGAAGDVDWFALDVVAGRTYVIDLEGGATDAGTLVDPQLRGLFGADGNRLPVTTREKDGGEGLNSRMTWPATETGTVYVAARGHRDGTGSYTVRVADTDPMAGGDGGGTGTYRESVVRDDDFTDDTDTTGVVTVGGSVRGEIETAGDQDWFAVALEADKIYQFDLKRAGSPSASLDDPYLRGIYDSDGELIADTGNDNYEGLVDSRVYFTATEDATYYAAAGGSGSETGRYRLSVEEFEDDDYTADTDTTGTVSVGGNKSGLIESAGDRDWFAVTLEAGKTYRIDLQGVSAGFTIADPYLEGVYDSNGDLIAGTTNDNIGLGDTDFDSRVYFTAASDATYYVSAGGAAPTDRGIYRLSVRDTGDDYLADTRTTGAVTVGGSATGKIESAGDQDWFAVTLEADTNYGIELRPYSSDPLADPYLRGVYDSNGDLIAGTTDDNSGLGILDSQVYFTANRDGIHYVAAGGQGNHTGEYALSVRVDDEFTADQTTTGGDGGRLGDGRDRLHWRPRLVQGRVDTEQDLPDRPGGPFERGRNPVSPVSRGGLLNARRCRPGHGGRRRRQRLGHQQPGGFQGAGNPRLLCGGLRGDRRQRTPDRHLQAVG